MQKRCLTGTIFEKFLCKDGFIHKSKSPKVKYSGKGKSILSKIKNSNYDPSIVQVLPESDFTKYDIINEETNEKLEAKKYKRESVTKWTLFSEPFFKIATRTQATKITVRQYNLFVNRFWKLNNKKGFFDDIITQMTETLSGICVIDGFIPIDDIEFRFVVKDSWMGYKRITLEFRVK
jgi:hypothetical protein